MQMMMIRHGCAPISDIYTLMDHLVNSERTGIDPICVFLLTSSPDADQRIRFLPLITSSDGLSRFNQPLLRRVTRNELWIIIGPWLHTRGF